jgi:exopolysaccharide biosynthesis polyprenyl glycosylphosphotransferase
MSTQTKKAVGSNSMVDTTMSVRPRDRFRPPEKKDAARVVEASQVSETAADCGDGAHLRAISQRDTTLRRTLELIDVLMIYAALAFVLYVLRLDRASLAAPSVLIAPFVVLAAKAVGLYDRDQGTLRKTTIDEVPSILYLSVLSSIGVWLAAAVLLDGGLDRLQVFALVLASFGLLTLGRCGGRAVSVRFTSPERCIVIGTAADAQRIARRLETAPGVNAVVSGRIALRPADLDTGPRELHAFGSIGTPEAVAGVIRRYCVERVIIAPDGHDLDEILGAIRLINSIGVKVSVLPRLLEVVGSWSTYEYSDGMSLLGVRQAGISKSSELTKRIMDVVGASLAFVVLWPVMAIIGAAVKLDSPGPLFFRQRRIGRGGEVISIVKFRSMIHDADAIKSQLRDRNEAEGGLFKINDDPRITRIGRFLRRTSLDELPQLLNVLRGSMSLVGPRPLVPDEDTLIEGWQRRRLAVKPGMTGLWQIFGSSRIPMNEMVKIDYLYGGSWSIWEDLKILLRTVPYVVGRRGM